MRGSLLLFILFITCYSWGQEIIHPSQGASVVKIAPNQVYQYYDNGGPNGNYTAKTNSLITIYPEKKGGFVSIKCDSLNLSYGVRMYIFDGNHPGSGILGYYNGKTGIKGQTYTASESNSSGAISIRFTSLSSPPKSGWKFEVSTSNIAGADPSVTTQDCSGAIKVCSDSAISTTASGKGIQELPGPGFWNPELNFGQNGEVQSNWYKFEVKKAGAIEFLITPITHTDFDWALWGPYKVHECPAWSTDSYHRASACRGDAHEGLTGLSSDESRILGHFNSSECFVAPLQVKPGEHYVLMIDDWSGKNTTLKLSWTFLHGASLECKKDKELPTDPEELDQVLTEDLPELEIPEVAKIEAEISTDQAFVTVSYPGAFEYKIENTDKETVITGHAINSEEVEITKLPAGTYRVSLVYKKIKQYTIFVKD